jgi:ribosomal protein L29
MAKENIKKEDLIKKMNDNIVSLRDTRFGLAGSKNRNVMTTRLAKREVARIKTSLREMK